MRQIMTQWHKDGATLTDTVFADLMGKAIDDVYFKMDCMFNSGLPLPDGVTKQAAYIALYPAQLRQIHGAAIHLQGEGQPVHIYDDGDAITAYINLPGDRARRIHHSESITNQ